MNTKRAFTLVEILVVIAIISILAALVTVAVAGAMRAGKRAAISMEMSQIAMALEHYKAEFGEYPPDFFDDAALVRHVKKRWPRFDFQTSGVTTDAGLATQLRLAMSLVYQNPNVYPQGLMNEWIGTGASSANIHCTTTSTNIAALAFWLGGFPNQEGRFEGFSADPEAPFGRVGADGSTPNAINTGWTGSVAPADNNKIRIGTPDKKVFAELEVNKNVFFFNGVDNSRTVLAPCLGTKSGSTILPIVYFRGKADGGSDAYYALDRESTSTRPLLKMYDFSNRIAATGSAPGTVWRDCKFALPYAKSGNAQREWFSNASNLPVWMEPTKYQLIHPGLDGVFGEVVISGTNNMPYGRIISTGDGIRQNDLDNLTNFSDYKELKSILP